MAVRTQLEAARAVTGDYSLDAAAKVAVHRPFRFVVVVVTALALLAAIFLDLWFLWYVALGGGVVSFLRDRELIVADGKKGAVAIPKRAWSRSAGPDYLVLVPGSVEHLGGRKWRLDDDVVLAAGDGAAVLGRIAASG